MHDHLGVQENLSKAEALEHERDTQVISDVIWGGRVEEIYSQSWNHGGQHILARCVAEIDGAWTVAHVPTQIPVLLEFHFEHLDASSCDKDTVCIVLHRQP